MSHAFCKDHHEITVIIFYRIVNIKWLSRYRRGLINFIIGHYSIILSLADEDIEIYVVTGCWKYKEFHFQRGKNIIIQPTWYKLYVQGFYLNKFCHQSFVFVHAGNWNNNGEEMTKRMRNRTESFMVQETQHLRECNRISLYIPIVSKYFCSYILSSKEH